MTDPVERSDLVEAIITRIILMLQDEDYQPGDRLPPQKQLSEMFQVGLSSLREAIRVLTSIGILVVRNGEGTFVRESDWLLYAKPLKWGLSLNRGQIHDLAEARYLLEVSVAEMAALRISEDDSVKLRRIAEEMKAAVDDVDQLVDLDLKFHNAVAEASHNEVLIRLVRILRSLLKEWMCKVHLDPVTRTHTHQEHLELIEALERHNPGHAADVMRMHLSRAEERFANRMHSSAS